MLNDRNEIALRTLDLAKNLLAYPPDQYEKLIGEYLTAVNFGFAKPEDAAPEMPLEKWKEVAYAMFPEPKSKANVNKYLQQVLDGLHYWNLTDPKLIVMLLAQVRAETAAFASIPESVHRFNTVGVVKDGKWKATGEPFGKYDGRIDIGNTQPGDGARFKGRSWPQITGRANYTEADAALGMAGMLVERPDLALDPMIGAKILGWYASKHLDRIEKLMETEDLKGLRRVVNGGVHSFNQFKAAYLAGMKALAKVA